MNYELKSLNKTVGSISLVIMPLMFTLSEIFHPITMDTAAREIQSAAQNPHNWFIAHIFALVALVFLPFVLLKLTEYIKKSHQSIFTFIFVITMIGILATVGLLAFDFMILNMGKIGPSSDLVELFTLMQTSFYGKFFLMIGPALFLLGFFIISILMLLDSENKRFPVILIIIGILIYAFAGPLVPVSNGHILVACGAFIMLIGFTLKLIEGRKNKKDYYSK